MATVREHALPLLQLSTLFVAWKGLLLLIALLSPGVGYDTSTSHLGWTTTNGFVLTNSPRSLEQQLLKLVRWDAIYYTHLAKEGHVFEQEWAFGTGLSSVISWLVGHLPFMDSFDRSTSVVAIGITLSHLAHWLTVIQVWFLARNLVDSGTGKGPSSEISFRAAALHIISPAGTFLSAPYSESLFACLSVSGLLCYVRADRYFHHLKSAMGFTAMVVAGIVLGLATGVRSNGILTGVTLLVDAATTGLAILNQGFSRPKLLRLASVVVAGLLVGAGLVLPQVLAYQEYCSDPLATSRRPWCDFMVPSIFTWVQSHYWNVGPFRYWTISNLPLFALAIPTLAWLVVSAVDVMGIPTLSPARKSTTTTALSRQENAAMALALPQLLLAILAFTSYHVQIITRLASGYPIAYIWLASETVKSPVRASSIVRWMVMYALIQAGLYASFLPPA